MTDFTKNEDHFAPASGYEEGPSSLRLRTTGQPELTTRPHSAKTFGMRQVAEAALPAFKATPAGSGANWRAARLRMSTLKRVL